MVSEQRRKKKNVLGLAKAAACHLNMREVSAAEALTHGLTRGADERGKAVPFKTSEIKAYDGDRARACERSGCEGGRASELWAQEPRSTNKRRLSHS